MAAARWWNRTAASAPSGNSRYRLFLGTPRDIARRSGSIKLERDDVSKSSRSKTWRRSPEKRSVVLIEQPDAGRFVSRRLREHLPRLAFLSDPDPPRLGHFPDPLFNRLELLLARLLEAALVGPALAPLGPTLFRVRAFDVGVAVSCEGVPSAAVFSSVCSADFTGCSDGCMGRAAATLLAVFSSEAPSLRRGHYWWTEQHWRTARPPPFACCG